MADFHQNGVISTLHNLSNRSLDEIELELREYSKDAPIELILPSLYSELEGAALKNIVSCLSSVKYLNHIIIGLDKADKSEFIKAKKFFSNLNQPHSVIWNDSPKMKKLNSDFKKLGIAPNQSGKGKNVWYCLGYTYSRNEAGSVALHDCDITTYNRELLARLVYPVSNPHFYYEFCKGYYPRIREGTLSGRVTRLLVTPLLKTFRKVLGHRDYIEFIDVFPTLVELTGHDLPESLQGSSLSPILKGKSKRVKDFAVSQYPRGNVMGYAMRNERYRYVAWYKNRYSICLLYTSDAADE